MRSVICVLISLAAIGLAGCSGIDLDPGHPPVVAKTPAALTAPPAELKAGTAQ